MQALHVLHPDILGDIHCSPSVSVSDLVEKKKQNGKIRIFHTQDWYLVFEPAPPFYNQVSPLDNRPPSLLEEAIGVDIVLTVVFVNPFTPNVDVSWLGTQLSQIRIRQV